MALERAHAEDRAEWRLAVHLIGQILELANSLKVSGDRCCDCDCGCSCGSDFGAAHAEEKENDDDELDRDRS